MPRKKKTELPPSGVPTDINALGVSGEKQKKESKKRPSWKMTLFGYLLVCGGCFFITSIISSKTPSTPTPAPQSTEVAALETTLEPPTAQSQASIATESGTSDTEDDTLATSRASAANMLIGQTETAIAAASLVPSATITDTPTSIPTQTAIPTKVATPVPPTTTPSANSAVQNVRHETRLIQSAANVRTCPRRTDDCEVVVQLQPGMTIIVTGDIQGDTVSQSTLWYVAEYESETVYVHSSLVAAPGITSLPSAPASNQSANQPVVVIPSNNQSVVPVQAAQQWSCGGDIYNCSDFKDNIAGLDAYFAACPGDPSNLDGHPENGIPCDGSR